MCAGVDDKQSALLHPQRRRRHTGRRGEYTDKINNKQIEEICAQKLLCLSSMKSFPSHRPSVGWYTHLATICFTWDMMRSSRKSYGNLVVHTPKNLTKHSSAARLGSTIVVAAVVVAEGGGGGEMSPRITVSPETTAF